MAHARVKLDSVFCVAQEDWSGRDEFYVSGLITDNADGDKQQSSAVLTKPLVIRSNQDKPFGVGGGVVFDADVYADAWLKIALSCFDEDADKNWEDYRGRHDAVAGGLAAVVKAAGQKKAAELVPEVAKITAEAIKADKEDHLGDIAVDVPLSDLPEGSHERVGVLEGDSVVHGHYRYIVKYTILVGDKLSENEKFLVNAANSGKVLDVAGAEHKDGAAVILYRKHGAPNQRFSIEPVGNDEYRIVADHSAKCLTVQNALQEPGTQVVQWGWGGGAHQRWRLEYDGGPLNGKAVRFVNTGSGLYLSVRGAQQADRTPLEIATPSSGLHQTFRLVDSPHP